MTEALAARAREPGVLDIYRRRASSRAVWLRGGWLRQSGRLEEGTAVRRLAGGTVLEARSERWPDEEPLPAPPDPLDLLPLAPGGQRPRQRLTIQTSITRHLLVTAAGFAGAYDRTQVVITLAEDGPLGRLARTRIACTLTAAEIAADLEELARAHAIAPRAVPHPGPRRLRLSASVAARVLAALWAARRGTRQIPTGAAELVDDASQTGGPLGAPFDGDGRPTRRIRLSGPAADPLDALGTIRLSFADRPCRLAANLRLVPRAPVPGRLADVEMAALELEEAEPLADGARLTLLGLDDAGRPARLVLACDLGGFLAAIEDLSDDLWWGVGEGAVGSPSLLLRLA